MFLSSVQCFIYLSFVRGYISLLYQCLVLELSLFAMNQVLLYDFIMVHFVPTRGTSTVLLTQIIIILGSLRGSPSSNLNSAGAVSPKLLAWGELEFRKAFLILSYIGP